MIWKPALLLTAKLNFKLYLSTTSSRFIRRSEQCFILGIFLNTGKISVSMHMNYGSLKSDSNGRRAMIKNLFLNLFYIKLFRMAFYIHISRLKFLYAFLIFQQEMTWPSNILSYIDFSDHSNAREICRVRSGSHLSYSEDVFTSSSTLSRFPGEKLNTIKKIWLLWICFPLSFSIT